MESPFHSKIGVNSGIKHPRRNDCGGDSFVLFHFLLELLHDVEELVHRIGSFKTGILALEHHVVAVFVCAVVGLVLPDSAFCELLAVVLVGQMIALGFDDYRPTVRRSDDEIGIMIHESIDCESLSRDVPVPPFDVRKAR